MKSRPSSAAFVVLPLVAGIAILVWVFSQKGAGPVTSEQRAHLIRLKNVGIGQLENLPNDEQDDGSAAIESLTRLAEEVPDELIGQRNLAIAWLLLVDKTDRIKKPDEHATALASCQTAIASLREREPDSGVPHILAAKLAMLDSDREAAAREFEQAGAKMEGDFVPWAELFMVLRDDLAHPLRRKSLQQAHAALPHNLVLLEHLVRQQADESDAELATTLGQAREALRPLTGALEKQGIDIAGEVRGFVERLESADPSAWEDIEFRMFQVFNVIRPEQGYQQDLMQLGRHALEYVIHDFSAEFHAGETAHPAAEEESIEVTFLSGVPPGLEGIKDARDVAACDFDMDDDQDLVILRADTIEVYTLDDGSGSWRLSAECSHQGELSRLAIADLDRDSARRTPAGRLLSDLDMVAYGPGGYQFFENHQANPEAKRTLLIVEEALALDPTTAVKSLAVADLDHDGDLDLAIATANGISLWSNSENWTFQDISARSGLSETTPRGSSSLLAVDFNRDILVDLIVAGGSAPGGRLDNIRHGRFRWQPEDKKLQLPATTRSIAACDADRNASWDLLVAGEEGTLLVQTQTQGTKPAWATQRIPLSKAPARGSTSWDFDNDGRLDVISWGDEGMEVIRQQQDGSYQTWPTGDAFTAPTDSCKVSDIDADGDLDLVSLSEGAVTIHSNEGGNKNHWIDIFLCAEADPQLKAQRTNFYGIGSRVEMKAGGHYQLQLATEPVVHFGLGQEESADVVRIVFTNGVPQNAVKPKRNQAITELQRLLKGSCPYLYTWTGEKFEFYTDLLWAAPIGLQLAEGVIAPTRDWESLLVEGDRLASHEGEYRMQITEELWEAAYFDEIQLIAVDHPDDTVVFSNEKVGPPSISRRGIHAFQENQLQHPRAARDTQGQDVLSWINRRDGRYLRLFDKRKKQGVIEDYFLELDLGQLDRPESIQLVLTGWVFPTDTSVNVAISQNPLVTAPRPPSVWMPGPSPEGNSDLMEGWRQVIPNMGFPGGKTKTIIVDLPVESFPAGDYRIRILSSMELYWDEIRLAVDAKTVTCREIPLQLQSADLHARGFSRRSDGVHNGPEQYDYDSVIRQPAWPPMEGQFTRFGDVRELIEGSDGRLVVMGAGDEMSVSFLDPGPPPAGWKRDFMLYSVGWDKDADLNTVSGHHVDPLPFPGMTRYPPARDDSLPVIDGYEEYLRRFQTRKQKPALFWHRLR